jgi:hypothetical protein
LAVAATRFDEAFLTFARLRGDERFADRLRAVARFANNPSGAVEAFRMIGQGGSGGMRIIPAQA